MDSAIEYWGDVGKRKWESSIAIETGDIVVVDCGSRTLNGDWDVRGGSSESGRSISYGSHSSDSVWIQPPMMFEEVVLLGLE